MDDRERRRYEMFVRVRQFLTDNAASFPVGSIGAAQLTEISAVIDLLDQLAGDQAAGFGEARFSFAGKKSARENVREDLSEIARTAHSMSYQFPHIDEKFRVPANRNDQQMLAAANAFLTEATPLAADFVTYGMPNGFLTDLQADIAAFENALGTTGSAIDSHVEATADIDEAVRRGMIAVRILNGVVKNIFRNDAGRLAAWTSASHIEKDPKKKPENSPTP